MQSHELVEVIFTKLSLVYGRDFLMRWEGLDIAKVKSDWAHELTGISDESVRHALRKLPDKPPNVLEFRNVAMNAPAPVFSRIDPPTANPELVKAEIAKARALLAMPPKKLATARSDKHVATY
ncbi:MAG: hypothetical protein ABL923_06670 [Burkholderiaceae bacterium]